MSTPYNDLEERRLRRLVEQHRHERADVHEIRPSPNPSPSARPSIPPSTANAAWRPL